MSVSLHGPSLRDVPCFTSRCANANFSPFGETPGLWRRRRANTSSQRGLANPAQSDWGQKRAIQFVAMTGIAKKPGSIPKTVEIKYVWECSLQVGSPLIDK